MTYSCSLNALCDSDKTQSRRSNLPPSLRPVFSISTSLNTPLTGKSQPNPGIPCSHITFDALRVNDPKQGGWPIHIIAFLWIGGWMPLITGMLLLVVTWVSFSSKNLLARPSLTGHPALFWGLEIPFLIGGIAGSFVCGVNYWYYFVSMRVAMSSWSAFFLILGFFAAYYGRQTLNRLRQTQDSFNYRQQLRILVMTVGMFILCGIVMGFHSLFMERIDAIYQVFILFTSLYRVCAWVILVGSAVYVWVSPTTTLLIALAEATAIDLPVDHTLCARETRETHAKAARALKSLPTRAAPRLLKTTTNRTLQAKLKKNRSIVILRMTRKSRRRTRNQTTRLPHFYSLMAPKPSRKLIPILLKKQLLPLVLPKRLF